MKENSRLNEFESTLKSEKEQQNKWKSNKTTYSPSRAEKACKSRRHNKRERKKLKQGEGRQIIRRARRSLKPIQTPKAGKRIRKKKGRNRRGREESEQKKNEEAD